MTKPQRVALERLCSKQGGSAYSLRTQLNTLNALERRGYVRANRTVLGAIFSPQTAIKWFVTDEGRNAYRQEEASQ